MKRIGMTINIRPEKIDEYKKLQTAQGDTSNTKSSEDQKNPGCVGAIAWTIWMVIGKILLEV